MRRRLSGGLLALLVLTAGAVLWLVLERPSAPPPATGRLLGMSPEEIVELRIESAAQLVVLRRQDGDWFLDGTVADLVDQTEAQAVVERVARAAAPPLDDPAAAGYGLDQPLLRLGAVAGDGRRAEALLGDLNPVAGRHYASVPGRPGVLTVEGDLVRRLLSLPAPLRLVRLWPPFEPAAVETLRFERPPLPGQELLARDAAGIWWLGEPDHGRLLVPIAALERERHYGDLTRTEEGRLWWRASRLAVELLLSQLEDAVVAGFGAAPAPPETLRAAGLLPPTVTIEVRAGGRRLRASFGHELERLRVATTRQDLPNLLNVTREPLAPALMPLGGYIELRALHFDLAAADSFRLERHDIPPLTVRRAAQGWAVPRGAKPGEAAELVSDLVHHLDALPMLGALPPATTAEPLQPTYLTTLLAYLPGEREPRRLRLGYLPDDRAVIHEPEGGRLLLVRPQVMVTLRAAITALVQPIR